MNIDFGSTPPADTSKLWVPLAKKPDKVVNSYSIWIEDFAQTKHVATSGSIQSNTAICKYGNGFYLFGGQANSTYGGLSAIAQAEQIRYFDVSTSKITTLSVSLPLLVGAAPCVVKNGWIYIFGANSNGTARNPGGDKNIVRFNPTTQQTEIVYRGSTSTQDTSAGGGWYQAKIVYITADRVLICPAYMGAYESEKVYTYSFSNNTIEENTAGEYAATYMARDSDGVYSFTYQSNNNSRKFNFLTNEKSAISFPYVSDYSGINPIIWDGVTCYTVNGNYIQKLVHTSSYEYTNFKQIPYALTREYSQQVKNFSNYDETSFYWYDSSNNIYEISIKQHLEKGYLYINCDYGINEVLLINNKFSSIYFNPMSVYLGDENSIAQKVDAYLYDNVDAKWKTLDGVSYTTDMRAALNIMGVT